MHTSIYDVVNELYKAFISDFLNEDSDSKKATKIRTKIYRLKNEEGSLTTDFSEFYELFKEYLDTEFKNQELKQMILDYILDVKSRYISEVWEDFNYRDSVDDNKAMFWKEQTEVYYQKFKDDDGIIYDPNENSFFYYIFDNLLRKFGITSPDKAEEILKVTSRNIKRWKAGETLPNSFFALKDDLEIIYNHNNLNEDDRDEYNAMIFFALGISRLREISKIVSIFTPQFIDLQVSDYMRLLERLLLYPMDSVNKRRFKQCLEKKEENITLESLRLLFCGIYKYFQSDFIEAEQYLLKVFKLGRYHIGKWMRFLHHYLLHTLRINNNKKQFKRLFNWTYFIGNRRYCVKGEYPANIDKKWNELNKKEPMLVVVNGQETIFREDIYVKR